MKLNVIDGKNKKFIRSKNYNYNFDKKTGYFERWGSSYNDDPLFSPGPEILDIEISAGKCIASCPFCYKANAGGLDEIHMTFDEYKSIIDKTPPTLMQVALGLTDTDSNPDFIKILEYTRSKGIIPNYTCNGQRLTDEVIDATVKNCGAVAVSVGSGNKSTVKKYYRRKKKI
jgi:MoaA/NifB/PqqE/SkfB family radical SAM enzyme